MVNIFYLGLCLILRVSWIHSVGKLVLKFITFMGNFLWKYTFKTFLSKKCDWVLILRKMLRSLFIKIHYLIILCSFGFSLYRFFNNRVNFHHILLKQGNLYFNSILRKVYVVSKCHEVDFFCRFIVGYNDLLWSWKDNYFT